MIGSGSSAPEFVDGRYRLDIDDLSTVEEGERLDDERIIELAVDLDLPRFPEIEPKAEGAFVRRIIPPPGPPPRRRMRKIRSIPESPR